MTNVGLNISNMLKGEAKLVAKQSSGSNKEQNTILPENLHFKNILTKNSRKSEKKVDQSTGKTQSEELDKLLNMSDEELKKYLKGLDKDQLSLLAGYLNNFLNSKTVANTADTEKIQKIAARLEGLVNKLLEEQSRQSEKSANVDGEIQLETEGDHTETDSKDETVDLPESKLDISGEKKSAVNTDEDAKEKNNSTESIDNSQTESAAAKTDKRGDVKTKADQNGEKNQEIESLEQENTLSDSTDKSNQKSSMKKESDTVSAEINNLSTTEKTKSSNGLAKNLEKKMADNKANKTADNVENSKQSETQANQKELTDNISRNVTKYSSSKNTSVLKKISGDMIAENSVQFQSRKAHNTDKNLSRAVNEYKVSADNIWAKNNSDNTMTAKSTDEFSELEEVLKDSEKLLNNGNTKTTFEQVINNFSGRDRTVDTAGITSLLQSLNLLHGESKDIKNKSANGDFLKDIAGFNWQAVKRNDMPDNKVGAVVRSDLSGLMDNITREITMQKGKGRNQIQIQLEPESLGKMKIDLNVEKGEVIARLLVESQGVKDYLEQNLSTLKNNLSKQGINLEQFEIQTTEQYDSDFNDHMGRNRNFNQQQNQGNNNSAEDYLELIEYQNMNSDELLKYHQRIMNQDVSINYGNRRIQQYGYYSRMNLFA